MTAHRADNGMRTAPTHGTGALGWRAASGRQSLDGHPEGGIGGQHGGAGGGNGGSVPTTPGPKSRLQATEAREAIVAATRRCFARHGFRGTSLADIAREYGGSKAALLYHFASKDEILTEIIRPLWQAMETLGQRVRAVVDSDEAREIAIQGMTDIAVRYRSDVALMYGEIPLLMEQERFATYKEASDSILDALAGRAGTLQARITSVVVVSGVANVCHEFHDVDEAVLRAGVEDAYRRLACPPVLP